MKKNISNYFSYEDILKHPSIKLSHDNLLRDYPNYKFLSIYHRDFFDKNLANKTYKSYLLLGSDKEYLIFLEQSDIFSNIIYINEKEFNEKLLSNNTSDYEFYEEYSQFVKNIAIKNLREYINSNLIEDFI